FCKTNDNKGVVFDASALFRNNTPELSPLGAKTANGLSVKANLEEKKSSFDDVKAFADNVSVKSTMSYTVTTSFFGLLTVLRDAPVSIQVTHTILLLPEQKMRPRVADARLGTFLTERTSLVADADKMVTYSVVNRWRLEPRDSAAMQRGELTEPIKPIVLYLDNAFPELWRKAARTGILRWNKAFEAIGFKDAIRIEDYPINDPEFDPDNLKYSCIRYVPTSISNAMGPSWVDPSTGEIINASVIVYNDVTKLINNWRFCQTAQVDERVRAVRMPDEVMSESLAYVLAHEVGHCLGFMHNMSASASYPVDSLRDARFTAKNGTTSSIMDYARFNYVAQPTDKGVKLTPPDLGVYDYYLVKYAYQPLFTAHSTDAERPTLSSWIEEKAGDARYRYGRQQISMRCDPTALEEDLGNDAIKASNYGIANLKYIVAHLDTWIPDSEDADHLHRQELYTAIVKQYNRYVQAVLMNIGGIKLYDAKDRSRCEAVNADYQRQAAKWVLAQMSDCSWLDQAATTDAMPLHIENAPVFVGNTMRDLLSKVKAVTLCAHISKAKAYTQEQFIGDLYDQIWKPTLTSKSPTAIERLLQRRFVDACVSAVATESASSSKSSITLSDTYRPSINQMMLCGVQEFGLSEPLEATLQTLSDTPKEESVIAKMFGKAGYNMQSNVSIRAIDETQMMWYNQALRCEKLLAAKVISTTGNTQAHYRTLLHQLRKALSETV
ncbi:MAG: zinc-dependent metalloprotease, partial [Alistipes sp.]